MDVNIGRRENDKGNIVEKRVTKTERQTKYLF